jgi:hypothetical protein
VKRRKGRYRHSYNHDACPPIFLCSQRSYKVRRKGVRNCSTVPVGLSAERIGERPSCKLAQQRCVAARHHRNSAAMTARRPARRALDEHCYPVDARGARNAALLRRLLHVNRGSQGIARIRSLRHAVVKRGVASEGRACEMEGLRPLSGRGKDLGDLRLERGTRRRLGAPGGNLRGKYHGASRYERCVLASQLGSFENASGNSRRFNKLVVFASTGSHCCDLTPRGQTSEWPKQGQ